MSEPENFLARWSRRKVEAGEEPAAPASDKRAAEIEADIAAKAAPPSAEAAEPFDLSTLPSLESITAGTDIRVFLQAGVPSSIRHAALRRAWVADPAIRDFVGLAENAWDFTKPETIPGFGAAIDPADVKRLLDVFMGDDQPVLQETAPETSAEAVQAAIPPTDSAPPPMVSDATDASRVVTAEAGKHSPEPLPHRKTGDAAAQEEEAEAEAITAPRPRTHGGALPS